MKPAPMTNKVQAIVFEGASPEPDVYDILQHELDAALYQHSIATSGAVRFRLSIYARKVEKLIGPNPPAAEPAPLFVTSPWCPRDAIVPLPSTPAGRLAMVSEMLGGTDPETGEEIPPVISREDAIRMLDGPPLEETADRVHGMVYRQAVHERDAERARNSKLADEAGALRSERDELLRENAVLRRENERLRRKQ